MSNIDAEIDALQNKINLLKQKKARGYDFYDTCADRHDDPIHMSGNYTVVTNAEGGDVAYIFDHELAEKYLEDRKHGRI